MESPVLALVILCFLGWIIVLKTTITGLRKDVERMREQLEKRLKLATGDVTITKAERLNPDRDKALKPGGGKTGSPR